MLPAYSSERTDDFLIVRDHGMQAFYKMKMVKGRRLPLSIIGLCSVERHK
jgi:hypothetical protein